MNNKIIGNIPTLKLSDLQKFHETTKLEKLVVSDDPKNWPDSWKQIFYKGYPRLSFQKLPKPFLDNKISLKEVLLQRSSIRQFSSGKIKKQDLGNLLFYSCGMKDSRNELLPFRFYPSAGARYPIETYVVILKEGQGTKAGIYHYHLKSHSLEILTTSRFKKELFKSFSQTWIKKAPVLILNSAIFYRTEIKYGVRGYRHILGEMGCLNQNFYLLSSALKLNCCAIGGYFDDNLNKLLDLDGKEESVIGVLAVGYPKPKK